MTWLVKEQVCGGEDIHVEARASKSIL